MDWWRLQGYHCLGCERRTRTMEWAMVTPHRGADLPLPHTASCTCAGHFQFFSSSFMASAVLRRDLSTSMAWLMTIHSLVPDSNRMSHSLDQPMTYVKVNSSLYDNCTGLCIERPRSDRSCAILRPRISLSSPLAIPARRFPNTMHFPVTW